MAEFLKKIAPQVEWERCFPACYKPAPKLGRLHAVPRGPQAGVTGRRLVEDMLKVIHEHRRGPACSLDFVLFIDDTDCRFSAELGSSAAFVDWESALAQRVREAADRPQLGFHALLAWPEIEAWLISDWDRGFAAQYPQVAQPLRQHVAGCILHPLDWGQVERFGGSLKNGTCEHKLSVRIQDTFVALAGCDCRPPFWQRVEGLMDRKRLVYSKGIEGPAILRRIDPDRVAQYCPQFRSALTRLRSAVAAA